MKKLSQWRRHPMAAVVLLLFALMATGGVYAVASTANTAQAETTSVSSGDLEQGQKLFVANCATCHGLNAQGGPANQGKASGPSLIGVGAAAVDFQVGTGRMPMQMEGPQARKKPVMFTDEEVRQLSAYVASLAPGPGLPEQKYLQTAGVSDEDINKGGEIFRVNCAMCHNAAAAGGALTQGKFAPSLKGVSEKHIYEAMITGPQNMPVFNDDNITPENKRDLIAYLKKIEGQGNPGGFGLGALGPVSEGLFIWVGGLGIIIGFTIWLTRRSS